MFWNSEFLDSSPSHIDSLLQLITVKLSDILFEEDLLLELKTSNVNLANFLNRPEIIAELVNNITQLTEKDCFDKLLYSRVHAAYISCEILTSGSSDIFAALMNHPESLSKIISCLTVEPKQSNNNNISVVTPITEKDKPTNVDANTEKDTGDDTTETCETNLKTNEEIEEPKTDDTPSIETPPRPKTPKPLSVPQTDEPKENEVEASQSENDSSEEPQKESNEMTKTSSQNAEDSKLDSIEQVTMTKVVPQKATLVSKLISTIHSLAAANLSCHITQDITSFAKLINLLVNNIDVSGSLEILSTFIKRTEPLELRYVFCEILSKLNFVRSLIDVMTLSDVEDKQRNACQLLCDIIVIGRQDASEQTNSGPMAQDMLAELLESTEAVLVILDQMFSDDMRNSTAIVCGMKVMQALLEQKSPNDGQILSKTIEQTQGEFEKYLIKFHELLLNPPKQEPIKTTFGIIQKPLGYMRLEVVSLIRALIATNSPNIIRNLVELKTMKVIIDLFIEYSWNNLLHTQVEQALCSIIKNCRHDEELNYQIDMQQQGHLNNHHSIEQPRKEVIEINTESHANQLGSSNQPQRENQQLDEQSDSQEQLKQNQSEQHQPELQPEQQSEQQSGEQAEQQPAQQQSAKQEEEELQSKQQQQQQQEQQQQLQQKSKLEPEQSITDSRALLSQLLNECDLIGRLLLPSDSGNKRNGEQANFGHIIQMINSIAINRDLDTIRDHLNEMKDKRPELYEKWTTFVNVDVASFKEISLFYDAQSANNNVNHGYDHTQHHQNLNSENYLMQRQHQPIEVELDDVNSIDKKKVDEFLSYFSFTREVVIPSINVDVLPKLRRSKNAP